MSQDAEGNFISTSKDIETDSAGLILTDESGRTSKAGVFAAGDAVTGPNTVVAAVNQSKIAVEAIHAYIQSASQKAA